jgi:hypothetical protein
LYLCCFIETHLLKRAYKIGLSSNKSLAISLTSKTLADCEEILQITARHEIKELELDIAEMKIEKVVSSDSSINDNNADNSKELHFDTKDDKLIIKLAKELAQGYSVYLTIKYSAGYQYVNNNLVIAKPRSGFHFIENDEFHRKMDLQAWKSRLTMKVEQRGSKHFLLIHISRY